MKTKKNKIIILLVALISISVTAQNKKWTLQEAVDYALQNNISVKQSQNAILSGDQDVLAAKGQFLPTVNGNVNHNIGIGTQRVDIGPTQIFVDRTTNNTSIGVGLNQTIFNGFRVLNLYKQSKLNSDINALELARIKDDISLNVVNAYLNILFNKENLETAKVQYAFSEKQLDQVKELVDAGVQPKANVYDAQATLSRDLQSLTVAENNYDLAILSMAQLLQVPLNGFDVEVVEVVNPSSELLYNDVQEILDYAYANRNEVKVAEKNIENAEISTKISKSNFLPSLSGSYNYGSSAFYTNLTNLEDNFLDQLNDQKGHSLSLNLSVPIFSQNRNKTNVAKSRIQEENAKLGLDQAKLTLESNIQRAFTDAKAAFRSFEAAKVSLESQEFAFKNAEERYNIGAMNAFDLEQSRLRLVNAKASLINAKYDFVFKTKVLDFYLGKPITQ